MCCFCVLVLLPEEEEGRKQSLASRLSEKFQASLSSDCVKDDDFQQDRKRIRTAENTVGTDACCSLTPDLLCVTFKQ